jgi:dipeptidyl aminopeptidase/acylaminoacyl peptidase
MRAAIFSRLAWCCTSYYRRPFEGDTDLLVLQTIIHGRYPLGDEIPTALRAAVEKALEKDPADRYQSMREMAVDLRRLTRQSAETAAPPVRRPLTRKSKRIAAGALIALASIVALAIIVYRSREAAGPASLEYTQLTNFADSVTSPALSPDGRILTFIRGPSSFTGPGQIYVKFLPDGEPKQLTRDSLRKMSPVFSPDGSRVAYTAVDDRNEWDTWEAPVLGGNPRRWLPNASGLVWFAKDKVLFSEKIRGSDGNHMKIVAAEESRAEARDVRANA